MFYLTIEWDPSERVKWVLLYMCKREQEEYRDWVCESGLGYRFWRDKGELHTRHDSPFGDNYYKVT